MTGKQRKPFFKFRPEAWLNDEGLALCSPAAHGLWIGMLARMHLSAEYGILIINGKPPTVAAIARLFRWDRELVATLLGELQETQVVGVRESDGAYYSRRMLRDFAAGELGRESVAKRWNNTVKHSSESAIPPIRVVTTLAHTKTPESIYKKNPPVVPQVGDAAPARSAKTKKAFLPLPFMPRDREREIAFNDLRMTGAEFETCLAEFIDWASTKGRRVAGEPNWNRTFENDLRKTAANWKTSFRKQAPNPFRAYTLAPTATQPPVGAALPTEPDWWAVAAAAIHEYDPAAWRSYGASAKAVLNDAGERVIFTAGSLSCERLATIVDALETTGRISGPPIFVKPPPRANVSSTN